MDTDALIENARGLLRQGRPDDALALLQQVLTADERHQTARHLLAVADIQRGDAAPAIGRLSALTAEAPDNPHFFNNLGNAHMLARDYDAALAAFEAASTLAPDVADFHTNRATAAMHCRRDDIAEASFRRALELEPDDARARHNLGSLLVRQGRFNEAIPILDKLAEDPACRPETLVNLATALERMNRLDEAKAALARVPAGSYAFADVVRARLARRDGDGETAIRLLDGYLAASPPEMDDDAASTVWQEIGLAADRIGDSERAFDAFLRSKAHRARAHPETDSRIYLERVRELRRARLPERVPGEPSTAEHPRLVFFNGFPRSGTTLLEAMLEAHPRAVTTQEAVILGAVVREAEVKLAAGRIDARARADARSEYFTRLASIMGPLGEVDVVIDKFPLSTVYSHWIDALYPQSRILMALRDPRDAVLSCLMQRFESNPAMRNFDTPEAAVTLYEEVMGLWLEARDRLSVPWLEYRYEDLVADQQGTLSRILAFVGLAWDPAIEGYRRQAEERGINTPSYRDVTAPVSSRAVGRWRAYREQLAPILPRLRPFVDAFGYAPD